MTTATGVAPLNSQGRRLPFSVALGFAVAATSAFGGAPPVYAWTITPTRPELVAVSPSSVLLTQGGAAVPQQAEFGNFRVPGRRTIAELRTASGLTTDQIGRLLGVSRRSVHNWINGNAMAAQHEERVSRLLALVQVLPGATPTERRSALLDSSRGESLFHRLLAERQEDAQIRVPAVSPSERIAL